LPRWRPFVVFNRYGESAVLGAREGCTATPLLGDEGSGSAYCSPAIPRFRLRGQERSTHTAGASEERSRSEALRGEHPGCMSRGARPTPSGPEWERPPARPPPFSLQPETLVGNQRVAAAGLSIPCRAAVGGRRCSAIGSFELDVRNFADSQQGPVYARNFGKAASVLRRRFAGNERVPLRSRSKSNARRHREKKCVSQGASGRRIRNPDTEIGTEEL
jgi:hypothetical protein